MRWSTRRRALGPDEQARAIDSPLRVPMRSRAHRRARCRISLAPNDHIDYDSRCQDLEIALREAATIRGAVRDSSGNPLTGVVLRALESRRFAKTDAEGRFQLYGLSPSETTISIDSNANVEGFDRPALVRVVYAEYAPPRCESSGAARGKSAW